VRFTTHCNTLQRTSTHRNTPQHTATHRNTEQAAALWRVRFADESVGEEDLEAHELTQALNAFESWCDDQNSETLAQGGRGGGGARKKEKRETE